MPMKILDYIRRKLSVRLSLWILCFATVIFVGSLNYLFSVSREAIRREAVDRATLSLDLTVQRVSAILKDVETAVDNTDWLVQRHLDTPDSMYAYSRHILMNNPDLYGCSLAFEPNYFKEKGLYFSAYSFRESPDSIETVQEGNDQYHYFSMDWYLMPKLMDKACWTEPFIDLDIDSTYTKEIITSYCKPLKDSRGAFVGVLSADISLSWLSSTISAMQPYPHSYNIMLGRGGTYLVHPDSTMLFYQTVFTQTLLKPNDQLKALGLAMQAGEEGMREIELDGHDYLVFYKPLPETGWSVSILCPESDIFGGYNRLKRIMTLILTIGLLLMLWLFSRIVTKELKPLRQLTKGAETIASGKFDMELPVSGRTDEIGQLSQTFSHMQHSLVRYIEELETTTAQKATIESELNVAKGIQLSMLPKIFPPFPDRTDIDIFGQLTSAKEVGGDLFDFYIRDEKLLFCIGDVSGKGIPASLLMTVTRSQFRTVSRHLDQPDQIVIEMNNLMAAGNDTHMFVTLFVGCLDLASGHLSYCCAAHNPPLMIGTEVAELPVARRLPIGAMRGIRYVLQETTMQPHTTIFLYTDGLTEAEDTSQAMFGEERMNEVARQFVADGGRSPQSLIERMTEAVHTYVAGAPQSDDLTMLAIQYNGH